jgi:Cytochrome bd terminal oxidase subunit I
MGGLASGAAFAPVNQHHLLEARPPVKRDPDRDHWLHRVADGDRGQRLGEPSGGFLLLGGNVSHVDPFKALFANTYLWHEFLHMYVAGYVVSGFILAGCYAYSRIRERWGRYERIALSIPFALGFRSIISSALRLDRSGAGP